MKQMIAIIDYGMGNIHSLKSILEYLEQKVVITRDQRVLTSAGKLILPGVGAFSQAMKHLEEFALLELLKEEYTKGKPILGICLGMQLLAQSSTEHGFNKGLSLVEGEVNAFTTIKEGEQSYHHQKVPHVGFNGVDIVKDSVLFEGINTGADFYFTHSYRMQCLDSDVVSSYTTNGEKFVSSIEKDNLFGTQFHPELSQKNGVQLMKNFIQNIN